MMSEGRLSTLSGHQPWPVTLFNKACASRFARSSASAKVRLAAPGKCRLMSMASLICGLSTSGTSTITLAHMPPTPSGRSSITVVLITIKRPDHDQRLLSTFCARPAIDPLQTFGSWQNIGE